MSEGLRARKMRLTRQRMERAAVDIAYAEGVGAVTVERVCALAEVSRSTFFNYFHSLEEAIFGAPLDFSAIDTDSLLAEHSDNLVVAANRIMSEAIRHQSLHGIAERRFTLLVGAAGITVTTTRAGSVSRDRLVAVLADWLDTHYECARLPGLSAEQEAARTVALSIALGEEVLRDALTDSGELPCDLNSESAAESDPRAPAAYAAARIRMAHFLTPKQDPDLLS